MKDYVKQVKEVSRKTPARFTINNLEAFYHELSKAKTHLSGSDPVLAGIIEQVGKCRLKPHKKYFETLVDAIISQQLSTKAAESILNRFKTLFNGSGSNSRFPHPEDIIAMDGARIRASGSLILRLDTSKALPLKL